MACTARKKVAFIDYNEAKQVWIISPTEHRHTKNIQVINGNMVLKTKPHTTATAKELEGYLDKTTGDIAPIYEVEKIHDRRLVSGEVEYKVSWKGYAKSHKTWEPAENLVEFGAAETVLEYELDRVKKQGAIKARLTTVLW